MDNRKDPPFFNEDNMGPFYYKLPFYTIKLFIETVTGTCFELRVSPFEAVISVKAKIQRLKGTSLYFQDMRIKFFHQECIMTFNFSYGERLNIYSTLIYSFNSYQFMNYLACMHMFPPPCSCTGFFWSKLLSSY